MQDIEKLKKLRDLAVNDKDAFLELLKKNPEVWESLIAEDKKNKLIEAARTETPEGSAAWYELLYMGREQPPHVRKQIEVMYEAEKEGMGVVFFGFRGSWKTISLSVTELARHIGMHPEKTNLVICAGDDSADKITKGITDIIEFHPAWKQVFPNVVKVPTKWSTDGYSVMDTSVPADEWAKRTAAVIDPTLVGGGYKSHKLNGKHPTGILLVDDIHDLENSSSERERRRVVEIFTATLLKTAIRADGILKTRIWSIGTPYDLDDVNHYLKNTGEFKFFELKAMTPSVEGEGVYCDGVSRNGTVYEDIIGWWKPNTKHYGIKDFIADRSVLGKARFWQMIQLDLAKAATGRLKYYEYPAEEIGNDLYTIGGCDPTTFEELPTGNRNSYFALAYLSKLPNGGAVVVDGELEQCSQLQAENHILAAQSRFSNWQYTAVENVGVGKVFLQTLQRNSRIKAIASGLKDITDGKINSKRDRVLQTHKWFENGTVKISNADTPFLNALRRLFEKFYDLDPKHDMSFDAFDSVFHALRNIPDILREEKAGLPSERRRRTAGPLDNIGLHIGYGSHG
ncbi:MAG: hypothetical protein E6Q68_08130 [Polynucleobacter sp.]|nr:MAG: hypothetical protein E6Q68_08130 [Polynucleobacter sp.]